MMTVFRSFHTENIYLVPFSRVHRRECEQEDVQRQFNIQTKFSVIANDSKFKR